MKAYLYIGEKSINKNGNVGIITNIKNSKDIDIIIDDTYVRKHIQYGNFIRGHFGSKNQPKICNVGYIGEGQYKSKDESGVHTEAYRKWHDMIERCYNPSAIKKRHLYKDVIVCEEWFNFQNFAKWYDENKIDYEDTHLDKDIIGKKSNLYSPNTCCVVPREISMIFTRTPKSHNDDLPVGVLKMPRCISKYIAGICMNGKYIVKSGFDNPDDAFEWYKNQKKLKIRNVAEKYKDILKPNVYETLLNYDIDPYPYKLQ